MTQEPAKPDDRATSMEAASGDTGEHYSGYTLMVEAYAAIWLILMAWLVMLWRKQADLTVRVEGLEQAINRAEKKASAKHEKAKLPPKPKPEPKPESKTETETEAST